MEIIQYDIKISVYNEDIDRWKIIHIALEAKNPDMACRQAATRLAGRKFKILKVVELKL